MHMENCEEVNQKSKVSVIYIYRGSGTPIFVTESIFCNIYQLLNGEVKGMARSLYNNCRGC